MLLLENISKKYYKDEIEYYLFKNISLYLEPKNIYLLEGPSGSGKTTFLNTLSLLDKSYEGKIKYNDLYLDIRDREYFISKRSYMKQENELIPFLSIMDQLKIKSILQKINIEERDALINKYALMLEIDGILLKKTFELSGGEKKRAYLLLILLSRSELYLFDEPTVHLEDKFIFVLESIFYELREKNKCIIISSHDLLFKSKKKKIIFTELFKIMEMQIN